MAGHLRTDPDAHTPVGPVERPHLPAHFVQFGRDLFRIANRQLSRLGESQAVFSAHKQTGLQFPFQRLHGPAERGLRNVQRLGRFGQRPVPGKRRQLHKLFRFNHIHRSLLLL